MEPHQHEIDVTFEVGCNHSPEVRINTKDGGQTSPMILQPMPPVFLNYGMAAPGGPQISSNAVSSENDNHQWLWDSQALDDTNPSNYDVHIEGLRTVENSDWWNLGNL